MKNIIYLLMVTTGIILIGSCKKETPVNSTGPGPGSSSLLKSWTAITPVSGKNDTTVASFTYDAQNRVITETIGTIAGSSTTTYTYYTDSVIQATSFSTITYYLNSMGYRSTDNSGETWTYNSNGYLILDVRSATDSITYTYNSSNQLATQTEVNGANITTDTYTYSSNPISHAGASWSMGQSAGALPATDVTVKNGVTTTKTFTYTTDSQGRLSVETVMSTAPGTAVVTTYYSYY